MRIAIFTNNYLPNPFGVAGSIESFRKEFEKAGHTVYVFAPEAKGYADENPNVFRYGAIDLKFRNIRFPIAIPYSRRIDKVLENLEIDIIHSQHPNLLGWQARRWAKKKNVPLVFTWHTLYDQYAHFAPLIPNSWAAKWAIGNAVKYANKCHQIIVPTESVKKIIRDWGVQNERIETIPTGVEDGFFGNPDRENMRKQLGVADDEIALLLVSRLTAEKNVGFLMRSVIKILKQNEKTKFIVAGDGDKLPELKKMVADAGLESRVVFIGIVTGDAKKNIYASGDIFVYASISETQGMILTEAMLAGLPIVAVNATGAKDIVINRATGILVDENEDDFSRAVLKVAGDEDVRKRFSENARKIAMENYVSSVCAGKMIALYEQTITDKK